MSAIRTRNNGPDIHRGGCRQPPRYNGFLDVEDIKPVDGKTWKLEFAGRISDKKPWTAQQIAALPEQEVIIRHVCVEGWDYIGQGRA